MYNLTRGRKKEKIVPKTITVDAMGLVGVKIGISYKIYKLNHNLANYEASCTMLMAEYKLLLIRFSLWFSPP